ncbi:MAG: VTT domain-containing protein [Thermoleophilia bacterium]
MATLKRHRHRVAIAGLWLAAIVGYQTWAWRSGLGPSESVSRIIDALSGSAWGPLAYIAVYLVRPLLLFSAAALTVAGGFLFGPVWGVIIVIVAANGSAMVAYGVGRWFGGDIRTSSDTRIGRYVERMRARTFETVLTLRLLLLPYDPVSYLAGFMRTGPVAFLSGTALGSLPGTLGFVLFGASIERFDGGLPQLDLRVLAASVVTLAVSLLLVRVVRRREGVGVGDA